jgi:hypothetical protein
MRLRNQLDAFHCDRYDIYDHVPTQGKELGVKEGEEDEKEIFFGKTFGYSCAARLFGISALSHFHGFNYVIYSY